MSEMIYIQESVMNVSESSSLQPLKLETSKPTSPPNESSKEETTEKIGLIVQEAVENLQVKKTIEGDSEPSSSLTRSTSSEEASLSFTAKYPLEKGTENIIDEELRLKTFGEETKKNRLRNAIEPQDLSSLKPSSLISKESYSSSMAFDQGDFDSLIILAQARDHRFQLDGQYTSENIREAINGMISKLKEKVAEIDEQIQPKRTGNQVPLADFSIQLSEKRKKLLFLRDRLQSFNYTRPLFKKIEKYTKAIHKYCEQIKGAVNEIKDQKALAFELNKILLDIAHETKQQQKSIDMYALITTTLKEAFEEI